MLSEYVEILLFFARFFNFYGWMGNFSCAFAKLLFINIKLIKGFEFQF